MPAASPEGCYSTGEFAKRAAVSVRTLRFYDREGLLRPSQRSETGHRLYSERDLAPLQRFLALKFLGFSLSEIRALLTTELQNGAETFREALEQQRRMLEDQQAHLDRVLGALSQVQRGLSTENYDWNAVVRLIEELRVDKKEAWVEQFFTPEQRETMRQLLSESYSQEAIPKVEERWKAWDDAWTEEEQKRLDARYEHIVAKLKRLVAKGAEPGSEEAQELAKLQLELIGQFTQGFTQGDPDTEAYVMKFVEMSWEELEGLSGLIPEHERENLLWWSAEEDAFLKEAMRIYRERF